MAKSMKSFRLDTESAMILEAHAKAMGISQADLIEQMLIFMSESGVFSALELVEEEKGYTPPHWWHKATKDGEAYETIKPLIYEKCMM